MWFVFMCILFVYQVRHILCLTLISVKQYFYFYEIARFSLSR